MLDNPGRAYIVLHKTYKNKFYATVEKFNQLKTSVVMGNHIELFDILLKTLPTMMKIMYNVSGVFKHVIEMGWFYLATHLSNILYAKRITGEFVAVPCYYKYKTNDYADAFMEALMNDSGYHETIIMHSLYHKDNLYKKVCANNNYFTLKTAIYMCNYDAVKYMLNTYPITITTLLAYNIYKDVQIYNILFDHVDNVKLNDISSFTSSVDEHINYYVRSLYMYNVPNTIIKQDIIDIPIPFEFLIVMLNNLTVKPQNITSDISANILAHGACK